MAAWQLRAVQLPFWIEPSSANDGVAHERDNNDESRRARRTHQPSSGRHHLLHGIRNSGRTRRPCRELVLLEFVADADHDDAERPHGVGAEA